MNIGNYEIDEYNILEWSCGMRDDYVYWLDSSEDLGDGIYYKGRGNGYGKYTNKKVTHTLKALFSFK